MAENITTLLSILWHANHFPATIIYYHQLLTKMSNIIPLGLGVTAGILCIVGSAIYFISTGMFHSQTLNDLSSEVVTNRRFSSTKVIVLTAPKCLKRSGSGQFQCKNTHSPVIFLDNVTRPNIPTNDLLIRSTGNKQVLFVIVRIKLDTIRYFSTGEP